MAQIPAAEQNYFLSVITELDKQKNKHFVFFVKKRAEQKGFIFRFVVFDKVEKCTESSPFLRDFLLNFHVFTDFFRMKKMKCTFNKDKIA